MDTSAQNSILEFLRENISNIHFKTLRENEREPSEEEKLLFMQQTLFCDPGLFLSKWGKYLPKEHLEKFDPLRGNNFNEMTRLTGRLLPYVYRVLQAIMK